MELIFQVFFNFKKMHFTLCTPVKLTAEITFSRCAWICCSFGEQWSNCHISRDIAVHIELRL